MAKKPFIPQSASELTAEWFSEVLGHPVTHVELDVVGAGIGFIGELHRCTLTWADGQGPTGDPAKSVIVKTPSQNDTNRAVGEALQAYEREIRVYRDHGSDLGLPMPQYIYSAFDPNPAQFMERPIFFLFEKLPLKAVNWLIVNFIKLSGKSKRRYLLMMEDIADASPPSQLDGGTVDDANAALEVLARFHGHNWLNEDFVSAPLIWPVDKTPKIWQASYIRNRDEFVSRFGSLIGDDNVAKLDEAQTEMPRLMQQLGGDPWTLIHGDYRLDNILYRPDGSLTVVDYQGVARGRPGWEVAYFITTALTPDLRSKEEAMLRLYHDALVASGVDDYPWETLLADVEITKVVLAHRMVCAIDTLDTEMGGDATLLDILVERVVGWID